MSNTRSIRVRLSEKQYQRLKIQADAEGKNTISSYVRDKLFASPYSVESKLNEILAVVKGRRNEIL